MKLNEAQLERGLRAIAPWEYREDRIEREFSFINFHNAIRFVIAVAESLEKVGHYPDIHITRSRVLISLSTHDEGGVTSKDIDLARIVDSVAKSQV